MHMNLQVLGKSRDLMDETLDLLFVPSVELTISLEI